jgi:hypothetical protein
MSDLPSTSFVMFDARLVIVEIPHAEVTTGELRDVEVYAAKFAGFERVSLSGEAMRDFIARIRDDFLSEQESGPRDPEFG